MARFIGQAIGIEQSSHCTRGTIVVIGTCLHSTLRGRAGCDVSEDGKGKGKGCPTAGQRGPGGIKDRSSQGTQKSTIKGGRGMCVLSTM